MSRKEAHERALRLIDSFGLSSQRRTLIGTPLQKGISGGQKRRVSVATQLITAPRVLYLDEPTSGLDSTASYEVMSFIRDIARENKLIVIASIHQPSAKTFNLFSKVTLMSKGKTCYTGPVPEMSTFFGEIGMPIPGATNPAEHVLDLVNIDFASTSEGAQDAAKKDLDTIFEGWSKSERCRTERSELKGLDSDRKLHVGGEQQKPNFIAQVGTLLHRSFIKSYRDLVTYWIRLAMYIGLAIMMGTVWLRLSDAQQNIQPIINAIVCIFPITPSYSVKLTLFPVLRLCLHVLHGGSIRASLPRRPRLVRQRARQWTLRPNRLPHLQLLDRPAISVHDLAPLLDHLILAHQPPTNRHRLLHLGNVALPGPTRSRIARGLHVNSVSQFCRRVGSDCFHEWVSKLHTTNINSHTNIFPTASGCPSAASSSPSPSSTSSGNTSSTTSTTKPTSSKA